ncbi:MAG: ATP:cob(I)alamin adenosyltransferase, partial [Dinghuibacter sp.]|nr:ATP:cob(I)alamin adenosyltransferase [Dinghuibacter sp.]
MSFKIYTKTGDAGETSLIGGTRVPKSHIRIESYGTVDELNSWMGLLGDLVTHAGTQKIVKEVQDRLFTIGSLLATDRETKMQLPDLHAEDITLLEQEIDTMDAVLPPMKSFI